MIPARHVVPPSQVSRSCYAPLQVQETRGSDPLGCEKLQTTTQMSRWCGDDVAVVVDVTVDFGLVGVCPSFPGHWQCEPADRESPRRSQYTFAFTGAAPDDPDEPPLSADEMVELAAWFDEHHDEATEHAADALRDCEA
jgi:hypothetical protein